MLTELLLATSVALATEGCFARVTALPTFETYVGVADDRATYLQPVGASFGLDPDARPFLTRRASVRIAPLCGGNYVAVWKAETFGNWPAYITARIVTPEFKSIIEDFRITERDEEQWEFALASLVSGQFLVTWKTRTSPSESHDIRIRGRTFDSSGTPTTPSFTISDSLGQHGQASACPTPDGGFLVLWSTFERGVYARWYDARAQPITSGTKILEERDASDGLVAYCVPDPTGSVSVFMRAFYDLGDTAPFRAARVLDPANGSSRLFTGEAISEVNGFQRAVETLAKERAYGLEHFLRAFQQKDIRGRQFCRPERSATVIIAGTLKRITLDPKLRSFATRYCRALLEACGPVRFREAQHTSCAER